MLCPYKQKNNSTDKTDKPRIRCSECCKAKHEWHLERLYKDLAEAKFALKKIEGTNRYKWNNCKHEYKDEFAKFKGLNNTEKCQINLFLRGFDVEDIEGYLGMKHIRPTLSKNIYRWVEFITGRQIKDWGRILVYLERHVEPTYRKDYSKDVELILKKLLNITLALPAGEMKKKGISLEDIKRKLKELGFEDDN